MTQPTAGGQFSANAENTSVLINLNAPENEAYRAPALALFHAKEPEYAPGAELEDDLSTQFGEGGFATALLDTKTNTIKGLAAGAILPSETAAFTYVVHEDDDLNATASMVHQTQTALAAQGVKAIVVEQEPEKEAQWNVMRAAGFVRVPVSNYIQPLDADSDVQKKGLVPIVAFSGPTDAQERSNILKNHFAAMTDLYDSERQQEVNVQSLARYAKDLDNAANNFGWNMTAGISRAPAPQA